MLCLTEAAQTILNDDYGAIDDQSKVERPETHQVSRNSAAHHASNGHEHRQRNHCCSDQRRSDIPQQQEQHDDDQQCAFDEILRYRLNRSVH